MKIPSVIEPEVIVIYIWVSHKLPARTRDVPYFVQTLRLISIELILTNLTKPTLHAMEYIRSRYTKSPPTCFGITSLQYLHPDI